MVTQVPYYDEYYDPKVAWARDHLFKAMEQLGVSPGTNDPLTPDDDLVPFLPEDDQHPIRPVVIPTTLDPDHPDGEVVPVPPVGSRVYVLTGERGKENSIVTIDDDFLDLLTSEAQHASPLSGTLPGGGRFLVFGDGRTAGYLPTFTEGAHQDPNSNYPIVLIDISDHPRTTAQNSSFTKNATRGFPYDAATSPDPKDQWIYNTTYNSAGLVIYRNNDNHLESFSDGLNNSVGGRLVVSRWTSQNRDVYIVIHGTAKMDEKDQQSRPARGIAKVTVKNGKTQTFTFNLTFVKFDPYRTPVVLALSSSYLFVAFPEDRTGEDTVPGRVDIYPVNHPDQKTVTVMKSLTRCRAPVALAVSDAVLAVAELDGEKNGVITLYDASRPEELSDTELTRASEVLLEGQPRSICFSGDEKILYVAHGGDSDGFVSVLDATGPGDGHKDRVLTRFGVDHVRSLVWGRTPIVRTAAAGNEERGKVTKG